MNGLERKLKTLNEDILSESNLIYRSEKISLKN